MVSFHRIPWSASPGFSGQHGPVYAHGPEHYYVRILETVGSGAAYDEVCDLESLWKEKLGSRVKGLNRN